MVSFETARVGSAVLTAIAFFIMVAVFTGTIVDGLGVARLTIDQARWMFVVVISSVPAFAAHGAATSFVDAFAQGKFTLPTAQRAEPGADTTCNPWRNAMRAGAVVGLPVALLAFVLVPRLADSESFSKTGFVLVLSACSGVLAAGVMFASTGAAFLREAAVPEAKRRFAGSVGEYIWQRHVIPQALINGWFNAWAGLSIVEGAVADPDSGLPRWIILAEAALTTSFLALGIALGTRSYAGFDLRWGVIPRSPERATSALRFSGQLAGVTVSVWLALSLVMFGFGIERLSTWPIVVYRAIFYGTYAGLIANWSARWVLATPQTRSKRPEPGLAATTTDAVP